MRLSVLYRRPLEEIRQWPASDIKLISQYLSREPAPDERIEYAIAALRRDYESAHMGQGKTTPPLQKFLTFHDAFRSDKGGDDAGQSFIQALSNASGRAKRPKKEP